MCVGVIGGFDVLHGTGYRSVSWCGIEICSKIILENEKVKKIWFNKG